MNDILLVALAGFAASFVDGALGMGFGPTSSSILLSSGLSPAAVSATVNIAKVATGVVSGASHWRFGNINRRLVARLAIPGAVGALVGVTILWSGWQLIRQSVIGLMDVAVEPKMLALIREIISSNAEGAIEAHDIRTRQAGRMMFIEFHLVVPGAMSVEAAHEICDRIEARLRAAVDEATITIHVEPENKAKHSGIVVV